MNKIECIKKAWTYEILMSLYTGNRHFRDFISEGIPRRTLSTRTEELESNGYLKKIIDCYHPVIGAVNNTEYEITKKGKECFDSMVLEKFPMYLKGMILSSPEKLEEILLSCDVKK